MKSLYIIIFLFLLLVPGFTYAQSLTVDNTPPERPENIKSQGLEEVFFAPVRNFFSPIIHAFRPSQMRFSWCVLRTSILSSIRGADRQGRNCEPRSSLVPMAIAADEDVVQEFRTEARNARPQTPTERVFTPAVTLYGRAQTFFQQIFSWFSVRKIRIGLCEIRTQLTASVRGVPEKADFCEPL